MSPLSPIAVVLFLMAAAIAHCYPGEAMLEEMRGARAFAQGDYEKALRHFEKALERTPSSVRVKYNTGVTRLKMGDRAKAREVFQSIFDPSQWDITAQALYNRLLLDHEDTRQTVEPLREFLPAPEQVPPERVEEVKQKAQEALQRYEKLLDQYRDFGRYGFSDARFGRNLEIAVRERDVLEDFLRRLPPPPSQPQSQTSQDRKEQLENQQQPAPKPQDQNQGEQKESQLPERQEQSDQQRTNRQQAPKEEEQQQEAGLNKDSQQQNSRSDQQEQQAQNMQQQESEKTDKQQREDRGREKKEMSQSTAAEKKASEAAAEPVKIGEMSVEEARRLLNSLPEEDKRALLRLIRRGQQQEEQPEERDW